MVLQWLSNSIILGWLRGFRRFYSLGFLFTIHINGAFEWVRMEGWMGLFPGIDLGAPRRMNTYWRDIFFFFNVYSILPRRPSYLAINYNSPLCSTNTTRRDSRI